MPGRARRERRAAGVPAGRVRGSFPEEDPLPAQSADSQASQRRIIGVVSTTTTKQKNCAQVPETGRNQLGGPRDPPKTLLVVLWG